MRNLAIISAVTAAVLMSSAPASALTSSFHLTGRGPGGEAFWTDVPATGEPVPGVLYTDTEIATIERATTSEGTEVTDNFLFVEQFTYRFDSFGNRMAVSQTFGEGSGPAVDLMVDTRKLLSASAVATDIPATTCTVDPEGGDTCSETTIDVDAQWTGTGDITRTKSSVTIISRGTKFVSHFRRTARDAAATGHIDGVAVPGRLLSAGIFDASFLDIRICHDC
jgi:hypothetical protein